MTGRPRYLIDVRLMRYGGAGVVIENLTHVLIEIATDADLDLVVLPEDIPIGTRRGWWDHDHVRAIPLAIPPLTLRHHLSRIAPLDSSPQASFYPHFDAPLRMPSPLITYIHDLDPLTQPGYCSFPKKLYFRWLTGHNFRRSRAVLVCSRHTRDTLRHHYPSVATPIHVAYHGVPDTDGFGGADAADAAGEMPPLPRPYLLYLGNAKPHKNLRRLLEAHRELVESGSNDLHLVLAGRDRDGFEQTLASLERRVPPDRIHILSPAPRAGLPILIREARALCMVSIEEGFGLPALEAISLGTEVVSSRAPALVEVLGEEGRYVESSSVSSIRDGLAALPSEDPPEARRARRERAQTFSWLKAGQILHRTLAGQA